MVSPSRVCRTVHIARQPVVVTEVVMGATNRGLALVALCLDHSTSTIGYAVDVPVGACKPMPLFQIHRLQNHFAFIIRNANVGMQLVFLAHSCNGIFNDYGFLRAVSFNRCDDANTLFQVVVLPVALKLATQILNRLKPAMSNSSCTEAK